MEPEGAGNYGYAANTTNTLRLSLKLLFQPCSARCDLLTFPRCHSACSNRAAVQ